MHIFLFLRGEWGSQYPYSTLPIWEHMSINIGNVNPIIFKLIQFQETQITKIGIIVVQGNAQKRAIHHPLYSTHSDLSSFEEPPPVCKGHTSVNQSGHTSVNQSGHTSTNQSGHTSANQSRHTTVNQSRHTRYVIQLAASKEAKVQRSNKIQS